MMRSGKANRRAQAFLAALGALFAVMLGMELSRDYAAGDGAAAPAPAEVAAPAPRNAAGQVFPLPPFSEYWVIGRRSLFHENRQAPDAASGQFQDGLMEANETFGFSLSAILIANGRRIALIRTSDDNRLKKLAQGENYRGWSLTEVRPRAVSLQRGAEIRQLELVAAPGGKEPRGELPPGLGGGPETW